MDAKVSTKTKTMTKTVQKSLQIHKLLIHIRNSILSDFLTYQIYFFFGFQMGSNGNFLSWAKIAQAKQNKKCSDPSQ